jgi:hypothetical protein
MRLGSAASRATRAELCGNKGRTATLGCDFDERAFPRRALDRHQGTALRGAKTHSLSGREEELRLLLSRWERTREGEGQAALIMNGHLFYSQHGSADPSLRAGRSQCIGAPSIVIGGFTRRACPQSVASIVGDRSADVSGANPAVA